MTIIHVLKGAEGKVRGSPTDRLTLLSHAKHEFSIDRCWIIITFLAIQRFSWHILNMWVFSWTTVHPVTVGVFVFWSVSVFVVECTGMLEVVDHQGDFTDPRTDVSWCLLFAANFRFHCSWETLFTFCVCVNVCSSLRLGLMAHDLVNLGSWLEIRLFPSWLNTCCDRSLWCGPGATVFFYNRNSVVKGISYLNDM